MAFRTVSYVIVLFLFSHNFITSADDDKVKLYSSDNFAESIKTNNHFVMFFAPWCGHCKRLHPIWGQLAEMLNEEEDSKVTIAKVDCTTDHELCSEQDVTGYPTLKFFKLGGGDSVKFRGTRDLPSLTSFINEQLGSSAATPEVVESPAAPYKGLMELTENNFESTIKTGNHFVKFFAPWCGHCQNLAPTWDELAENFESNSDVSIAKVDCTVHRSVCNSLEIKGYPTLLFFKDGSMAEKYSGQRTLDDLKSFVKRMTGAEASDDAGGAVVGGSVAVPLLNAETFRAGIAEGISFVKFFAPWCGHCKRLAPTWNELSIKLKDTPNVRVVRVDCTQPDSKELCNEQEVEGFPTLLVYQNGEKVSEYNGSRNIEDIYQFIAKYFQRDEL